MIARIVNAFTDQITGGNPAGVVTNPKNLNDINMIEITKKLKVSETAFVYPSKKADYRIRFFSPEVEVDLCGHATIATFYIMAETGLIKSESIKNEITQETNVGVLPVDLHFKKNMIHRVMMTQKPYKSMDIDINFKKMAEILGIKRNEIIDNFPTQLVSTGLFTLPIAVKSFNTLKNLKPNYKKIQFFCENHGCGSFHVFSLEPLEENSLYHSRNFAPCYGINEDPVTGTANGAVVSYLINNRIISGNDFICEQGDIIGRPGRIHVEIDKDKVRVGGRAKLVKEINIRV
jgi:trans-2,3-dihydro-3-hydroxyanthranilate isomerase